jgi:hypothetical protein
MTTTIQSLCKLQDNAKCRSLVGTTGDLNLNGKTLTAGVVDLKDGVTVWGGNVSINSVGQSFRFFNGTDYSMSDGKLIVRGGTASLNGSVGSLLNIRDLDLDLAAGTSGTATYVSVYDSICTYITSKMSASDGTSTNAGGTNTGWNFGDIVVAIARNTLSIFKSSLFHSFLRK